MSAIERRRLLGWIGLAGLTPMWLAGASVGASASGQPKGGGGSSSAGKTPARPDSTARGGLPPPSGAPGSEPSPDARDLAAIARRRYAAHVDAKQLEEMTRALDRGVQGSGELRKAKLENADEPDFVFRAEI